MFPKFFLSLPLIPGLMNSIFYVYRDNQNTRAHQLSCDLTSRLDHVHYFCNHPDNPDDKNHTHQSLTFCEEDRFPLERPWEISHPKGYNDMINQNDNPYTLAHPCYSPASILHGYSADNLRQGHRDKRLYSPPVLDLACDLLSHPSHLNPGDSRYRKSLRHHEPMP